MENLSPFEILIFFKKNPDSSEILNYWDLETNDNQKAMLHNLGIEFCYNHNKTVPSLTDKELLYIINNVNAVKLVNDRNLFNFYKEIIKKTNKCKKLLTYLYSKVMVVDNNFLIEDELDYNLEIFAKIDYERVPFYYLFFLKEVDFEFTKRFIKENKEIIKFNARLFSFSLSEYNYKLLKIILRENKECINVSKIYRHLKECRHSSKSKNDDNLMDFIKLLLENKELKKDELIDIVDICLEQQKFQKDFIFKKAKEIEEKYNYEFCNSIRINKDLLFKLKKYGLSLNFNNSAIKDLNDDCLLFVINENEDLIMKISKNYTFFGRSPKEDEIHKKIIQYSQKKYHNLIKIFKDTSSPERMFEMFCPGKIPKEIQEDLSKVQSIDELSLLLLKKNTKKSREAMYLLFDNIFLREERVFWIYHFVNNGFNYDLILNYLKRTKDFCIQTFPEVSVWEGETFIGESNEVSLFLSLLKEFTNERRTLLLIGSSLYSANQYRNESSLLYDVLRQLKKIKQINYVDFARKEIRKSNEKNTIEGFHRILSEKIMIYLDQEDFDLQQDEILFLEDSYFKNFKIHIPRTNHELINTGNKLNICVGEGYYAEEVVDNKIYIIFLQENNEPKYCVEFNPYKGEIVQSKTDFNEDMDENLTQELEAFINEAIKKHKENK